MIKRINRSCRTVVVAILLIAARYVDEAHSLVLSASSFRLASGNWAQAKADLRNPNCCVVSVSGLELPLKVLQEYWARAGTPSDVDLRARIRVGDASNDQTSKDCLAIRRAVMSETETSNQEKDDVRADPCTAALEELARGVASLADGPLDGTCKDVFMRVVCASSYKARDPMFHTDKAPLRGYVTLCGPGTDYMMRTCTPLEYLSLRSLGTLPFEGNVMSSNTLRRAPKLEFIVMKGDHYSCDQPPISSNDTSTTQEAIRKTTILKTSSWTSRVWKRSFACVHRSPPADTKTGGGRRVIVSLDLADGDDDREWYEVNKKREWRSGMTQRKSRLVA